MTFIEMLQARWRNADSMACVGLDTDYAQIPVSARQDLDVIETMRGFNASIVALTRDFVCAFKPNMAFYEEEWLNGLLALKRTIGLIRATAPDIPIILDAKRADIGNTNRGYAAMAFDTLRADAITVNPYFGGEALKPFLDRADKGVIVICRTTNPGAKEIQDLLISVNSLPEKARGFFKDFKFVTPAGRIAVRLYEYIAYLAAYEWNMNGNVLLVVGATYPLELAIIRKIVGDMPILVPGIGAQGGELEATVKAGLDSTGFGMIINSSRGIIFASKGEDFSEVAGREAKKLRDQINAVKATVRN